MRPAAPRGEVALARAMSKLGLASRSEAIALVLAGRVRVNGAPFAVIMRTPGHDVPLAAGFLLAEDVVRAADDIASIEQCDDVDDEARGNVLNVTVTGEAAARVAARLGERRQIITTAACGLCGRRTIESLRSRVTRVGGAWTVPAAVISRLPDALRAAQTAFALTGGIHASTSPPRACSSARTTRASRRGSRIRTAVWSGNTW